MPRKKIYIYTNRKTSFAKNHQRRYKKGKRNRKKWCSTSSVFREMQIQTTVSHHYLSTRIVFSKPEKTKCWCGYRATGSCMHYIANESAKWYSHAEKQLGSFFLMTPFLGIYPGKLKTYINENVYVHRNTHKWLFIISKKSDHNPNPCNWWMN